MEYPILSAPQAKEHKVSKWRKFRNQKDDKNELTEGYLEGLGRYFKHDVINHRK